MAFGDPGNFANPGQYPPIDPSVLNQLNFPYTTTAAGGGGSAAIGSLPDNPYNRYVPGQGYTMSGGYNGNGQGYQNMGGMGQLNGPIQYGTGVIGGGAPGAGYNPALANQLAQSYQKNYNEAKQANLDRYNQLLQADTLLRNRGLATADQQVQTEQGLYGRNMGTANQIVGNANDLYNRGMGDMSRYETAQNSQINQDYTSAKQAEQLRLASSGLSNSTVLGNSMAGIDRNRAMSLGLLARDLVGVDSSLTGQKQSALSNLSNVDTGSTNAVNAARQNYMNTDQQDTGNLTGVIERRSDPYPSMDQYAQMMLNFGRAGAFGYGGGYGVGGGQMGQVPTKNPSYNGWAYGAGGGNSGALARLKAANYQPYGGWSVSGAQ